MNNKNIIKKLSPHKIDPSVHKFILKTGWYSLFLGLFLLFIFVIFTFAFIMGYQNGYKSLSFTILSIVLTAFLTGFGAFLVDVNIFGCSIFPIFISDFGTTIVGVSSFTSDVCSSAVFLAFLTINAFGLDAVF